MASRNKLQVPCAASWLAAAAILLCVATTAAKQVATCQLELKGYGVGVQPGIKYGSLNCSTSDGSLLPVGLDSSYLGIRHLVMRGVSVKKDLPCMPGRISVGNNSDSVTILSGILYFCGMYHVEITGMIIHDLWTDQKACFNSSIASQNPIRCCALKFKGVSATIKRGSVVKNSVGSVICTAAAKVEVSDSQFDHNTGFRGAAVTAHSSSHGSSNLTIHSCVFSHNTATSLGGAVHVSSSACSVTRSNFTSNSASSGGALALRNAAGSFVDSLLDGNRCTMSNDQVIFQGGGLYADSTSHVEVHGCTFSNNQCQFFGEKGFLFPLRYYGGGMSVGASATVTKSIFKNNDAMYGGGLAAGSTNQEMGELYHMVIKQCNFQHNGAFDSLDGDGGGIFVSGRINATVAASQFSENTGSPGSAVSAQEGDAWLDRDRHGDLVGGSHFNVSDCRFFHNPASPSLRSRNMADAYNQSDHTYVIYISGSTAHIANSNITTNYNTGIGFAGYGSNLYIINSNISSNTDSGVWAQGPLNAPETSYPLVVIINSLISDNKADHGAGLLLHAVQLSVSLSTQITGNKAVEAGGGVWLDNGIILHPSQLQHSVHDNLAPVAPDVFVAPTTLSVISNGTNFHGLVTNVTDDGSVPLLLQVTGLGGLPADKVLVEAEVKTASKVLTFFNHSTADGLLVVRLRLPVGVYDIRAFMQSDGYYDSNPDLLRIGGHTRSSLHLHGYYRGCKEGQVWASADGTCQTCPTGSYSVDANATQCQPCPRGAACLGGAFILPEVGYWHSSKRSAQLHKCANRLACQQSVSLIFQDTSGICRNPTAQQSIDGRLAACDKVHSQIDMYSTISNTTYSNMLCSPGYTGNVCGECSITRNYALVKPFKCEPCNKSSTTIGLYIVAGLLLLLFIKLLCYFTLKESAVPVAASTGCTSVAPRQHLPGPAGIARTAPLPAVGLQPTTVLKPFIIYLQYLLIVASLNIEWPAPFAYPLRALAVLFSSASGEAINISCVLPNNSVFPLAVRRTLFYLAMPGVMLLVLLLWECTWHARGILKRRARNAPLALPLQTPKGRFADHLLSSIMVVVFFFLPSLARTTFSLFACMLVDEPRSDSSPSSAGRFWLYDMGQHCYQGYHRAWAFGLGVPMVFLLCVALPAGIFYITLSRCNQSAAEAAAAHHYGFLYLMYTPRHCYWEAIIALQTLGLVAISVFGYNLGSYAQVVLMGFALAAILAVLVVAKPYAQRATHTIMCQGVLCTCLTTYVALTFWPDDFIPGFTPSNTYRNIMAAFLLLLNAAYVVSVAWRLHQLFKWKVLFAKTLSVGSHAWNAVCGVARKARRPTTSCGIWPPK